MTTLTQKFEALEQLLATNQTALMNILGQILEQLGGAPPEATTTLQDVVEAVNSVEVRVAQGNAVLNNIANYSSQISTNTGLTAARSATTATNTGAILQFLQTTDFCCGDGPPALFPPPLSDTPIANTPARCQNTQLMVDIIHSILTYYQSLIDAPVAPTTQQIADIYSGDERLANCPKPSQVELATMLAAIMGGKNAGVNDLPSAFSAQMGDLIIGLFAVDTAQEGWETWTTVIQGGVSSPARRELMTAAVYNGLFNCLFSDTSGLDGSAYQGDLCGEVVIECQTASSILVAVTPANGYPNRNQIVFGNLGPVAALELGPGLFYTSDPPAVMTENISGGTINYVDGRCRIVYGVSGVSSFVQVVSIPGDFFELPLGINYLILDDWQDVGLGGSGPFSVEFCPGEPA